MHLHFLSTANLPCILFAMLQRFSCQNSQCLQRRKSGGVAEKKAEIWFVYAK